LLLFIDITNVSIMNRHISIGIATRVWAGVSGFHCRQELGIFLFSTLSRPALGLTQPSIQWVPEAISLGVKWTWC